MDEYIRNMVYNRYKGYVISYICNKGTTKQRAVKNIKTGLKKGELSNQDVKNILTEVYNESAYFSHDRIEKFEDIQNEIKDVTS